MKKISVLFLVLLLKRVAIGTTYSSSYTIRGEYEEMKLIVSRAEKYLGPGMIWRECCKRLFGALKYVLHYYDGYYDGMDLLLKLFRKGEEILKSCSVKYRRNWIVKGLLTVKDFEELYSLLFDWCFVRFANDQGVDPKDAYGFVLGFLYEAKQDREEMRSFALKIVQWEGTNIQAGEIPEFLRITGELQHIDNLGWGSFGVVDEVEWLGNRVARKTFKAGSRIDNEITALLNLKHPNIVRVIGISWDENQRKHSMVMEKMSSNLHDFIRSHRELSMLSQVFILLRIAKGMGFLHSNNVIHRDLKPENILLNWKTGDVKIADFGTCRMNYHTSQVDATSNVGTMCFKAPEMFTNQRYSRKVDVYSYGMVCYYVICGKMPFQDDELLPDDLIKLVCKGRRPRLPASTLASLVEMCWSRDVGQRPTFDNIIEQLQVICYFLLAGRIDGIRIFTYDELLSIGGSGHERFIELNCCTGVLPTGELVIVSFELFDPFELYILATADHPNIARIYGMHTNPLKQGVSVVCEFPTKGPLLRYLRENSHNLSWGQRLKIALGCAGGVLELTRRGILYEIRLESVFLDNDLIPKVCVLYRGTSATRRLRSLGFLFISLVCDTEQPWYSCKESNPVKITQSLLPSLKSSVQLRSYLDLALECVTTSSSSIELEVEVVVQKLRLLCGSPSSSVSDLNSLPPEVM